MQYKWRVYCQAELVEAFSDIIVSSSNSPRRIVSRTGKISLKTILDTFFVPFYYTKNTRIDVFNNYNQRVMVGILSNIVSLLLN